MESIIDSISLNVSAIPNYADKSPSPNLHSLIFYIISTGKNVYDGSSNSF